MLRLRDFILLAVLWSASSFILTNPSLSTTKHSFRPGHSPTPTITSFLLPPSPVLASTSQSAPSRCSLFPLYSQIDPHRRSNRPSTIPATINLIVSTLKSAGSLSAPLDRATAANDAMTSHLAKLEADKNDVDAASIVLTDDEVVVMAGRVMQVVVRYEQLDNDLRRVVSKDESVGSWGKLWDAYGITNKPLFDGDEGGGVDDVAKMRGEVIVDESVPMLEELYLSTRVGCLLGLFVVQHEVGVKEENKIEGMGVVDFLEDEVVKVLLGEE